MFCCCCSEHDSDNQQPLLTTTQNGTAMSERKLLDNLDLFGQKNEEELLLCKEEEAKKSQHYSELQKSKNEIGEQEEDCEEEFEKKEVKFQRGKKSRIWEEEEGSDLIYYKLSENSCRLVSFALRKKHQSRSTTDILSYLLKKSTQKENVIVSKEFLYHTQYYESQNNTFVLYKGSLHQQKDVELVKVKKIRSVRFDFFDQIIIKNTRMDTYEEIKKYCLAITQNLAYEELVKVVYVFPYFLNLHQISTIVFKNLEKYIKGEPMEKIISQLTLQMDLIQCLSKDAYIIVRHRSRETKAASLKYDQRKLSLVVLLMDHHKQAFQLHRTCYCDIRSKNLKQFLQLREEIQNQPSLVQTHFPTSKKVIYSENIALNERTEGTGLSLVINKKQKKKIEKFYYQPSQALKNKPNSDTPKEKQQDEVWYRKGKNQEYKNDLEVIGDDELDDINVFFDNIQEDDDEPQQNLSSEEM